MNGVPEAATWALLIPIVAIIGGFVIAGLGIYAGIRKREFEHRERLAMIEKGLAPSDPTPGATAQGTTADTPFTLLGQAAGDRHEERALHARRGGFILMAIGFGIGFLIWMTDREVGDAVGVGGFMLILGAAIYVTSYFGRSRNVGPTPPGGSARR